MEVPESPPDDPADAPFATFVTSLPAIACLVGPDGEVLVTNEAWRAFGQENDNPFPSSTGENYLEVCRRADDPIASEVCDGLERLLDGERETFRTSYPCPGPENARWFDLLAWRVVNDGDPYVLVLHVDTTSEREAEIRTYEEVERLEALARVLSHDLRTPLSVASGYCALLEEELDSPYIEKVEESIDRIAAIAENAVLIARGTDVDETTNVDLESVAAHVWESLDTGDAALFVDGDLTVQGDQGLVTELLENLFRNALEHAGPTPTVLVGPLEHGDGFYVADDGPGIPAEQRDDVFDIGYTTGAGTGFGLDIVDRIVEAHGWDVVVDESEEGGARFEVYTDEGEGKSGSSDPDSLPDADGGFE